MRRDYCGTGSDRAENHPDTHARSCAIARIGRRKRRGLLRPFPSSTSWPVEKTRPLHVTAPGNGSVSDLSALRIQISSAPSSTQPLVSSSPAFSFWAARSSIISRCASNIRLNAGSERSLTEPPSPVHPWRGCRTRARDRACVRTRKTSWLRHPTMVGPCPYAILLVRSTFKNVPVSQQRKLQIVLLRNASYTLPR